MLLCMALVAGLTVLATLILQGAQENLRRSISAIEDLGVDLVVVPRASGYSSTARGNVDLEGLLSKITAIPGVERASVQALENPVDRAPNLLVKVLSGDDSQIVAVKILRNVPGVTVLDNTDFFRMARDRAASLMRMIPAVLALGWALAIVWIGLIFAIAVNQRRREVGVLRALGAPRGFVLRSFLAEGLILAVGGNAAGTALTFLGVMLFGDEIARSMGLPLGRISPAGLMLLALVSLGLALASVFLAALIPAWSISRQDPDAIMKG